MQPAVADSRALAGDGKRIETSYGCDKVEVRLILMCSGLGKV